MERNRWRWALRHTRRPIDRQTAVAVVAGFFVALVLLQVGDEERGILAQEYALAAGAVVAAVVAVWILEYALNWWRAPRAIRQAYDARISELEDRLAHDYSVVLEKVNPRGTFNHSTDWSVDLRLRNFGAAGMFTVRVMEFEGQDATHGHAVEAPWFVRWRKPDVTEYPLRSEDAELLYLAETFPNERYVRFFAPQHDPSDDTGGYDAELILNWCRLRVVVWVEGVDEPIEQRCVSITSHSPEAPIIELESIQEVINS